MTVGERAPQRKRRWWGQPRGQAMVEYSFISQVLLLGGAFGAWVFIDYLMYALDLYFKSIYWVITSPVP